MGKVLLVVALALPALVSCQTQTASSPQASSGVVAQDVGPQPMREVAALSAPAEAEPEPQAEATAVKQPFMFNEADLPQGFPKVGPVGEVMVKDYPAHRLARVQSKDTGGQNAMFNPLFNHIKRNKIAMTAPVEMVYEEGVQSTARARPQSMAFYYRAPSLGQTGSDAKDPRVQVEDIPALTVLSVAVRGGYDAGTFQFGLKRLEQWLQENPGVVRVVGPPRYMGYNSPFVPWFLRMGEVQLPVQREQQ